MRYSYEYEQNVLKCTGKECIPEGRQKDLPQGNSMLKMRWVSS